MEKVSFATKWISNRKYLNEVSVEGFAPIINFSDYLILRFEFKTVLQSFPRRFYR